MQESAHMTESDVVSAWRTLFHGGVNPDKLIQADALIENLRPESPLRHRLQRELNEIRKLKAKRK